MSLNIKKEDISKFKIFLKFFSRIPLIQKKWFLIAPLLFLYVFLTIIQPYFYKIFIDTIQFYAQNNNLSNSVIFSDLGIKSTIFLAAAILLILVRFLYRLIVVKILYKYWQEYLLFAAKNFILLPINFHINKNIGERTKIYDKGTFGLFWGVFLSVIDIIPTLFITFAFLIFGFYINFKMSIVSFFLFPVGLLGIMYFGKLVFAKQRVIDDIWDKVYSRFSDSLININLIKIFVKEKSELEILKLRINESVVAQLKYEKYWAALMVSLNSFGILGQIFGMIFGTFLVIKKELSISELVMFIAIISQVYGYIATLFWHILDGIIKNIMYFGKLEELIDTEKEIDNGTIENIEFNKSLVFKNVSFSYPNVGKEVLKNINLEIKKGQKIALVGQTGSGKSTIANLITRFYNIEKGEILLDDTNIYDIKLSKYRQKFGQVFQDTTLFNDTILNNLKYINEGANFDDIKKACREAEILDFIELLENGFDTIVGERGLRLSGGEKQRLSIARVFLVNPEILILDEATSALDAKIENLIQKALKKLTKGKTSIIIAHRLSTIKEADNIFVINFGEIVGNGTFEYLYENNAYFKEIVDLQKNGFIE
ncbi:ABC transporter ATP-binding protein/permease [Candidatus Gracilibacteria bacterium]|nr:ABC transporter ATP-binding protein/permease [Candidatus Gracilibacteria bacterium]